jgi:PTH1 family peptidyl-tRNA hydrolase
VENSFLIAGLGNPGVNYSLTRHNTGFMAADMIHSNLNGNSWQNKFKAEYVKTRYGMVQAHILKPQTFMNLSGQSVAKASAFFKIDIKKIIIIHDDIDLDYGIVRVKSGGGTGGHKGLESCKKELGTTEFTRIRIGVGRPVHGDVSNFVLGTFTADEQIDLEAIVEQAAKAALYIMKFGTTKAMNQFNKRQGDN